MIVLGLLLVILAIAIGAVLFIGAQPIGELVVMTVFDQRIGLTPLGLVVAGAVVIALLWLGWALLRSGTRRSVRRRREAKESARQAEIERKEAVAERERLAELERQKDEHERAADRPVSAATTEQRTDTATTDTATTDTATTDTATTDTASARQTTSDADVEDNPRTNT